ncbi:hypothetical protein BHE74_00033263 [Ensete ventricosum]|nr:hypothetical protein BHE74_00033263 [Ensete ventricosum]
MSSESFELAIPLNFVSFAQLFRSLRNTSHFARSHLSPSAPLCLEHRQVLVANIELLLELNHPNLCALRILLRLLVLVVPLAQRVDHFSECQTWMPAPLSDSFSYISMSVSPKRLRVLAVLHTAQLGPPRLYDKCFCVCLSRFDTTLSRA